jgi:hypothetical protein
VNKRREDTVYGDLLSAVWGRRAKLARASARSLTYCSISKIFLLLPGHGVMIMLHGNIDDWI